MVTGLFCLAVSYVACRKEEHQSEGATSRFSQIFIVCILFMMDWKTKAKRKREALLLAIPQDWRIHTGSLASENAIPNVTQVIRNNLSNEEITITETRPHVLLGAIAEGLYTSTETLRAFSHRASIAHQLVRERAVACDETRSFWLVSDQGPRNRQIA